MVGAKHALGGMQPASRDDANIRNNRDNISGTESIYIIKSIKSESYQVVVCISISCQAATSVLHIIDTIPTVKY